MLPTLYEGYGMAVAEALARGLPVVSTATGAIAGSRSAADAAGHRRSRRAICRRFTDALSRVLGDAGLRARLAAGARRVRDRLPTWDAAAAAMAQALDARGEGVAMAGFSADWLALREPADHAARSVDLTRAVLDALPRDRPLRVLDLAAGTGSNLRYLSGAVPERSGRGRARQWLLVDHDPALLARVPKTPGVETRCLDLATLDDRDDLRRPRRW